jgi:hypothetical protein
VDINIHPTTINLNNPHPIFSVGFTFCAASLWSWSGIESACSWVLWLILLVERLIRY